MGGNASTAAPSKKAKMAEEVTKPLSMCIAPHPVSKGGKPAAAPSKTAVTNQSKKCSSPTEDDDVATEPEEPKTPSPPLNKVQVNNKNKGKEVVKPKGKPQPIR